LRYNAIVLVAIHLHVVSGVLELDAARGCATRFCSVRALHIVSIVLELYVAQP
jgi:hypothetical protein